jgi:hypothetical protein
MTVVILAFVTGIFVENGRQREAATAMMRERLSAFSALDLVGSDFAGAIYLARGTRRTPTPSLAFLRGRGSSSRLRSFVTQAGPAPIRPNRPWIGSPTSS